MAELAVILVTWNVRGLVLDALASLYADLHANGPEADVYVVDCASTDGTADAVASAFPQVRLTASTENLGFGRGNNLAIRATGVCDPTHQNAPRAVYLLNPDTITQAGATRTQYETLMRTPQAGLVGAQLAFGDGSFQHSAFAFPGLRQLWVELFPTPGRLIEGRFNGRYPRSLYQAAQPFKVDFVLGATMMLRREVIQQTGMFDEQFFMYCEEIDWAWRIQNAGWDAYCIPAAHVTHLGGQSTGQIRPQSLINLWTSRLQLFRKHYPPWKFALARRMVQAGMQRRLQQSDQPEPLREAYQHIYRLAHDT